MTLTLKSSDELRTYRRRLPSLRSPITVACLWPKTGENLGTIARTCDAIGAKMVIPEGTNAGRALKRGNTIGVHNTIYETVTDPMKWLASCGMYRVAIELAHGAVSIAHVRRATTPTVIVVGHETLGVPNEALAWCQQAVEIPMSGVGNSLNVAVAVSLLIYKMSGLLDREDSTP